MGISAMILQPFRSKLPAGLCLIFIGTEGRALAQALVRSEKQATTGEVCVAEAMPGAAEGHPD
jgi:hypothetical protein